MIACDGQRPSCQACLKRSKTCVYTEKPARGASDTAMAESYEVLQLLKAAPEPEALDILRMLRANRDPSAVLAVLKDSTSSNLTPSEPGADNSYINLSRSRFEHELMRNYPTAYPAIRPLPLPRPEMSDASPAPYFRRTRSMDQRTILGIHLSGYGFPSDHMTGSSYLADTEDNPFLTEPGGGTAPTSVPICDERLHRLDMSFWTDIPLSNDLLSLFYQQPGLEYPEYPPALPIPGDSPEFASSPGSSRSRESDANSQIPERIPPIYMGETFTALCRFWRILHGVSMVYYNRNTSTPAHICEHVSIEFAERKYRELLAWIETLPSSFAQAEDSPHHVMTFHLWFHAAILDIFRPFLRDGKAKKTRLTTFSSRKSSAEAAFKASVNQLKRLIVVYRSEYQSSAYTILWHTALIYVANAVLKDTGDPEWRFYFLHCVYGYESLRKSYRLAEAIGRALLAMTLRNGDITGLEARTILQQLKQRGLDHPSGDIRATFMGDLELAMTNPGEAKVETLAGQFEDVALFQEFIDMESTSHDDMFMDIDNFDESHTHRF
ncbi:hypothetical protein ACHAPH_007885 [Verticillium nonalfalfae]